MPHSDATFNQEKWNDKKNRIMDYFSSQYVDRLHTKYVRYFIVFKMISMVFIVSI